MSDTVQDLISILDINKAQEIESIDVRHLSPFFETFIICTAGSEPHSKSLANKLIKRLKQDKDAEIKVEGYNEAQWILINHGFTAVHIFLADEREKYSLDKLWKISSIDTEDSL